MRDIQQAIDTLRAANASIDGIQSELSAMAAETHPNAAEIECREYRLRDAEEARSTAALRVLQFEADAMAAELLALDRRRCDLLARLHGFLAMDVIATPDNRSTRTISAALLSRDPDAEELADPTRTAAGAWRLRFEGLVAGQIED